MKEEMLTLLVNQNADCEEKALKGSVIARHLSIVFGKKVYTRSINELAKALRKDNYRVISSKSCNGGYFITSNIDELAHFINTHKSHANHHLEECSIGNSLMIDLMDENTKKGINNLYQQKSPSMN